MKFALFTLVFFFTQWVKKNLQYFLSFFFIINPFSCLFLILSFADLGISYFVIAKNAVSSYSFVHLSENVLKHIYFPKRENLRFCKTKML